MFRRIIVVLVPGFVASLIAGWLLSAWSSFDPRAMILISSVIGILCIVLLVFLARPDHLQRSSARVASDLKGKRGVKVKDVELSDKSRGNIDVASNIASKKGDVEISKIKVNRGTGRNADNRR